MKIVKKIRKKRRKLIRRFFKSPIKKRLAQYSKTHPRFRKCWKKVLYTKRRVYYWWRCLGVTPDEKTVVFNSFNGKTYGCSPKAVYEYMRLRTGRLSGHLKMRKNTVFWKKIRIRS